MRRLVAFLLFAILLVNSAAFYVYYLVQLQQIHNEMRAKLKFLPAEDLEILTLTPAHYAESRVGDDEVKVNGKMYDIARIERAGHMVRIYCVHDEREDHLISLLGELISKPLKDRSSMPHPVLQFISMSFLLPAEKIVFQNSVRDVIARSTYVFSDGIARDDISTPPPKG